MTQSDAAGTSAEKEAKLPRRDWILLPLLCLLTICGIAASVELIAERLFAESKTGLAHCLVLNDASTGVRGIPNCSCREKIAEAKWVDYRLNSSGYRSDIEFGPKQPGTYRIVMNGASVALGERVQREESFAALLPAELSRLTGRKIELYNEAMGFGFTHNTALRFNDVLDAQPDMVLWIVTPIDVESGAFRIPPADFDIGLKPKTLMGRLRKRWEIEFGSKSISDAVSGVFLRTSTALMLRHYIYQSQSTYLKAYLLQGDQTAGFLKAQPSALWQKRLQQVDADAADMEGRAKAAGVPFVSVLLPLDAQAAMISSGEWPQGYDPYKLDDEMRSIITSHGGIYADILPGFRDIRNPGQYFMPVDGHINPGGHELVTRLLAKTLTNGAVPALRVDAQPQAAMQRGR
jgi:hypothetical protein